MPDYSELPSGLPVPVDDGAADHLPGMAVPNVALPSTHGTSRLATDRGWSIVYVYPRTGGPGIVLPDDWDSIPGARGCTPQSCAYRDRHDRFAALGASVMGLSAQPLSEQVEFAERMSVPYPLVNDTDLTLAGPPLHLPVHEDLRHYRRLTMAIHDGVIRRCWYPVFPPDRNAEIVLDWLIRHQRDDREAS